MAEFAFGVIAAIGAVFTAGKFEKLNSFAYRNLQVMQIVREIFICTLGIIYPNA